jgi:hypothetical protein
MALVVGQVVRVRVAVILDQPAADNSVGQVFDEEANQWADLVWVDLGTSAVLPIEFGDVEFWCEVYSLTVARSSLIRPGVRLRAWRSGGLRADAYEILTSGSTTANVAKLTLGGADLVTTLPGQGTVVNKLRITGFRDQRVGWTGRVPAAFSWDRSTLALRKRVKYGADDAAGMQYLSGVAGFSGGPVAFLGWLDTNLPEYGSPITVGGTVEFSRLITQGTASYRYKFAAVYTLHLSLSADATAWVWTTRGALLSVLSLDLTLDVCGGRKGVLLFANDTYPINATNVAVAGSHPHYDLSFGGGVIPTPSTFGGRITVSPRASFSTSGSGATYGIDATITVTAAGRISGIIIGGYTSDGSIDTVSAWGACKMEGGLLA